MHATQLSVPLGLGATIVGRSLDAGDLRVAGWNAQRMSKTQIQFVDTLGYDVVFLLETHDSLNGMQDYGGKNRLLTAGQPPSNDKAGAVGGC